MTLTARSYINLKGAQIPKCASMLIHLDVVMIPIIPCNFLTKDNANSDFPKVNILRKSGSDN